MCVYIIFCSVSVSIGHLLGKNACFLGFGFQGWIGVLIASVPDLCMLFNFVIVLVIVLLTGSI